MPADATEGGCGWLSIQKSNLLIRLEPRALREEPARSKPA